MIRTKAQLWLFVAGVTLPSILLSLAVTRLLFGPTTSTTAYTAATLVPSIVAPLASIFAGKLILKVVDLQEQAERAAKEMEEVNEALEETLRKQMLTFSIIGHEVRSPAASIKMMLDAPGFLEKDKNMKMARSTASHMIDVLDDMRHLANPNAKLAGSLARIKMSELIQDAADSQMIFAQKQNIAVTMDIADELDTSVECHAQMLRQVFINIVRNCLLHSEASELDITARRVSDTPMLVEVTFRDNGRGVAPDQQAKIFDLHGRGETTASGLGLGLHVCHQFLRMHLNGDMTYQDTEGGGATFTVSFPVMPLDMPNMTADQTSILAGLQILLVEDSAVVRNITKIQLESRGAYVDEAVNGRDGLNKAMMANYDLILTDVFMPELSGTEMVRLLRAQNYLKPIVGLTANTSTANAKRFSLAGASFLIEKPVDLEFLEAKLTQRQRLRVVQG